MFFTGALGALFMYSILHRRDEHRRHSREQEVYEQRRTEEGSTHQSLLEQATQRLAKQQEDTHSRRFLEQTSLQETVPSRIVYVPRDVVRNVAVDCPCKCACKTPEKPELPRSFWSLDQGRFVRSVGDKEARETQEKRRNEVAKMMKYWSLDQGMHAGVKASV
jgi:hypothetical protein